MCCRHYCLSIVPFLLMLQTRKIKLKPKDCIFFGKSLYIQFKSELISTGYIPNNVRKTSAPNSHKCKLSPYKYEVNSPKRKNSSTQWLAWKQPRKRICCVLLSLLLHSLACIVDVTNRTYQT